MTLSEIVNHKQNIKDKLESFIMCYHGKQKHIIIALADKLEHMIFYIGSPSSLDGFLNSIAEGKVKRWSTGANYHNGDIKDPRTQGAQLKGMSLQHITRLCSEVSYKKNENGTDKTIITDLGYIQGHFRWDWRGYTLDRETRDYIRDFWFNDEYIPTVSSNRMKDIQHISILEHREVTPTQLQLIVETKNYRWSCTKTLQGTNRFSYGCSIGNGDVTTHEINILNTMIEDKIKEENLYCI